MPLSEVEFALPWLTSRRRHRRRPPLLRELLRLRCPRELAARSDRPLE
jgi:hypothetical protein